MPEHLDHSSISGALLKTDIAWTGPMPFLVESPLSSDFLTMPLFDGMQEWSTSGSTPGVPAPSAEGLDNFQQQQQHQHQQTFMDALIESNLFSPDQPIPPYMRQYPHQHLALRDALLDGSTTPPHHPFAASPPSCPVPMRELTPRGSISSISSGSSAGSAGSYCHATWRPSDLLAQHPCSYSPDRETVKKQKRERFLERNRIAANKCRRKKKEHMRQLECKCLDVTQANTRLESEVSQLRSQILELKNELLQHSRCDDPGIKAHLARMVASLSKRSASVVSTRGSEADMKLSDGVSGRGESVASMRKANSEKVEEAASGFKDMVVLPAAATSGSKLEEE
ncbi:bZIP transcription factor, partial [Aspergillus homomorphus CBS 101889]